MSRRIKFVIAGFFLIITFIFLIAYMLKNKEDSFADEIISDASESFSLSLDKFLSSAQKSVVELNSNLKSINSDNPDANHLNEMYSKVLIADKYLVGIALSSDKFRYVIYRDNSSWTTTFDNNLTDSTSNWRRLNNKLEVVSEWTDITTSFPSKNNMGNIEDKLKSTKYIWNIAENAVIGSKKALSIVFNATNGNNEKITAGLIYNSLNISHNFATVLKYEEPLVSVLTVNDNIVSPMITNDSTSIIKYNKLSIKVHELIADWKGKSNLEPQSFSFEEFNEVYWTRIISLTPKMGIEGFAVTISGSDLAKTEQKQERLYLYISLLFAVITFIWFLSTIRRQKFKYQQINDEIQITDVELLNLISKGETEFVEFKSSLRWDYRDEKINKILEDVILKSINAFANAKGGQLIIGVSDDLEILGLQNDFNTLKKKDADYFELHLRKLINNQYGIAFSNENLSMKFYVFDGKTICLIQIEATKSPIFLKTKNKQGTEVEKFYVRSGNASQEIRSLTEMNDYIKVRFDK